MLLRNVESDVLVVALKGADEKLREKILGCTGDVVVERSAPLGVVVGDVQRVVATPPAAGHALVVELQSGEHPLILPGRLER